MLRNVCVTITRKYRSALASSKTAHGSARCCPRRAERDGVGSRAQGGPDREALDDEKRTPLIVAACGGRLLVAETLLDAGANPIARCCEVSSDGARTALGHAAYLGQVRMIQAIPGRGVDVNDRGGVPALCLAPYRCHRRTCGSWGHCRAGREVQPLMECRC